MDYQESFITGANTALNEFIIKFMWMLCVLKITVSKWTQYIIHRGKLVMVPTLHLCDAVIYIGSQIQGGLIENYHYIYIRRIFNNRCPQVLKGFKDAMVFFVVLSFTAIYLALRRIFQHNVPLATEAEVVRRCKDCFQQIKTMCISRHSPLILFDNDDLETVLKSEENVQRLKQNLNISQVVGSSAGIAGGVATLVGFALAPFTFGASTLLTVVGLTLSLSGATMSIGATVVNINGKKTIRKNLDVIFIKYFRLAKSIGKLVQLYVQLRDILEQLPTFPNKMELTEAMGEKMNSLSKIRHDISVLQISIEPLPDKVKNLVDIMNNLCTVVEEVIEQMHNNPDNRDEVIQKHDPVTVKDAVDIIGSDHRQQSTLLSDFILRFFGYTDANDETTDDPTDMETKMDIRPTLLFPSAKYSIVFETIDIAMELADDIFLKASESLKVLSKIGILITAVGIVIDVGVLTKSLVDLSNGSEEQLRVHFRNCRLHMELINSIPGIQQRNQEIQFFGLLFHPIFISFIAFLLYFIFC